MKLGNAAWGFRQTPLDKQLKITSAMGLALLEFNINNPAENSIALKATDDEIETVRRLYKKYNIELLCAASGNDFTRPKEDDNYTELRRCFDIVMLAEKLGIKKIRFFAGFSALKEVKGKRFSCMIKCLNDLCGFAADHNVSISLETHGGVDTVPGGVRHFPTVSTDQAGIKSMLAKMDSRIMFNYDPSNLLAAGSDPLEIWDIIKDRVDYMHLKDFIPVAGKKAVLPGACGAGNLDWKNLAAVIENFNGPVFIEYENTHDIEHGLKSSLAFLQKIMRTA